MLLIYSDPICNAM